MPEKRQGWEFSPATHRYRDRATGRFLSPGDQADLAADFAKRRETHVRTLADQVAKGEVTVQAWQKGMSTDVRRTTAALYALGRGGRNAMTAADWKAVKALVSEQSTYLESFAADIKAEKLSAAQIKARASMYVRAGVQAHDRGVAASYDVTPHVMPGEGSPCGSNCRCRWVYASTKTEWRLTWTLSGVEHCDVCIERASEYDPLVIPKSGAVQESVRPAARQHRPRIRMATWRERTAARVLEVAGRNTAFGPGQLRALREVVDERAQVLAHATVPGLGMLFRERARRVVLRGTISGQAPHIVAAAVAGALGGVEGVGSD